MTAKNLSLVRYQRINRNGVEEIRKKERKKMLKKLATEHNFSDIWEHFQHL
jgi:hypothetical protein